VPARRHPASPLWARPQRNPSRFRWFPPHGRGRSASCRAARRPPPAARRPPPAARRPPPREGVAAATAGTAKHRAFDPRPRVAPRGGEPVVGMPAGARGATHPRGKVAASMVWEMLRAAGVDPAPDRAVTTWARFLRSQAEALLAADFLETITLTGTRLYILVTWNHAVVRPVPRRTLAAVARVRATHRRRRERTRRNRTWQLLWSEPYRRR